LIDSFEASSPKVSSLKFEFNSFLLSIFLGEKKRKKKEEKKKKERRFTL